MKKLFYIFSIALVSLAACTRFEKETAPVFSSSVASPSIAQEEYTAHSSDSSFAVKITPGKGNNYYTFAIIKGKAAPLDGETLLTGGYTEKSVSVKLIVEEVETDVFLSGCFKASAQADTTVVAFDLIPNTDYTVYAIGNDEKGKVSDIASLTIRTTDQDAPSALNGKGKAQFDASELEDGTFVIKFDDDIDLTDAFKAGTKKFYAHYLASNDATATGDFNEIFVAEVPVDSVSVSGKKVSIQVPERIPGAVVAIGFDAGVVKNELDAENAEAADVFAAYWDSDEIVMEGFAARFKTAEWKFALPMITNDKGQEVRMPSDTVLYFNDWTALQMEAVAQKLVEPKFQTGGPFNAVVTGASGVTIRYTDSKNRRVVYDAAKFGVSAASDSTLVILLDEQPEYGSSVSFDIAKGCIEDLWGNPCAEFSTYFLDENDVQFNGNYFFSYGYDETAVLGTYSFSGMSKYAGAQTESKVVIAPCKEADAEHDFIVYDLFKSTTCLNDLDAWNPDSWTKFYADFDPDAGIFTVFGDLIGTGTYKGIDYPVGALGGGDEDEFTFSVPAPGYLVLTSTVYMYMVAEDGGTWDVVSEGELTRTSDDYSYTEPSTGGSTPDPAPAVNKAKKLR